MALTRIVPTGDIDLEFDEETGLVQLVLLSGSGFVRQKIASRLKFFLGEWFLNLNEGMPYYRVLLVRNPDMTLIRTLFRRAILSVQEVAALTKLELDFDAAARRLGVEFDATLVAGGVLVVRQPDPAFVVTL